MSRERSRLLPGALLLCLPLALVSAACGGGAKPGTAEEPDIDALRALPYVGWQHHDLRQPTSVRREEPSQEERGQQTTRDGGLAWLYEPPENHRTLDQGNRSTRSGDRRTDLRTERRDNERSTPAGHIFDREDVEHLINLYDGEIRFTDEQIGRLLDALERQGLVESSIVVFLADHGEWLGEENRWDHCQTLDDREIRVPFMVVDRGGRLAGLGRVQHAVSTLDLAPTILSRLQIDYDPSLFDGLDIAQPERSRVAVSSWRKLKAVRNREWKLILRDRPIQLYNLVEDPYESSNLVEAAPEVVRRLVESLSAFSDVGNTLNGQNEEVLKNLRTLGYVD